MNILVIGSGGREHALCWKFEQSPRVRKLYCANGNAGIAQIAECPDIKPDEIDRLADFAAEDSIDLTFVGGETSLALGVVDEFESRGLRIVGPNRLAAQLEASKSFAKDFMTRHDVPTAKYRTANSPASAVELLESGEFGDESTPVVVKADGLAAGKGVVVAENRAEAIDAINEMAALVGADAARKIVIEQCLVGREVSLLMFADGEDFALMPPVRDHKRIGDGDKGPNTGGMGTITDSAILPGDEIEDIIHTIIEPTLSGCINDGFPFRGILFLGLMMTETGPMLLEYNVRFGDPETQAIMVGLETDLVDICEAMLDGSLSTLDIKWRQGSSACVVLASEGYPSKPRIGDVITGLDKVHEAEVFHAGTKSQSSTTAAVPEFITSGGRVLGVTATGDDLKTALSKAYSAVEQINWPGMQYRKDIGR
ncbi:MAG: phosphoribosylamine--glycine ligase [Pyrinomonadaceae bacterium]